MQLLKFNKNMQKSDEKIFYPVFIFFILTNIFLVTFFKLYPFIDLPEHLALATIYRFYENPENLFRDYFVIDSLMRPHVFFTLFCSSKFFLSVEVASKIFFSIYVVLLPISVLMVIKKMGGNRWFSLLSFLLTYNFSVSYGFVDFMFSLPFTIFFLCYLLDLFDQFSWKSMICMTGILISMVFLHLQSTLVCVLMLFTASVFLKKDQRFLAVPFIALGLSTIILVLFVFEILRMNSGGLPAYLLNYFKDGWFFLSIIEKRDFIYNDFAFYYKKVLVIISILFPYTILICNIVGFLKWKWDRNFSFNRTSCFNLITGLYIFFTLLYFLLPEHIPNQAFVSKRFSFFSFLFSILLGSLFFKKFEKKKSSYFFIGLCCFYTLLWGHCLYDFNKKNENFNIHFFSDVPAQSTMGSLLFDSEYGKSEVYPGFLDYFIVWKQGIAPLAHFDFMHSSVTRKGSWENLPSHDHSVGKFKNYDNRFKNLDYLLVRGEDRESALPKFYPNFIKVREASSWSLYKNVKADGKYPSSDS